MNSSPLQKGLEWVYNNFKKNTATMLVITGTIGWGLSSLAQIGAVIINPKIPKEQKSFLVPQEFLDAVVNIGSFFMVYYAYKNFATTLGTVGASIVSSNIITPILRNSMASNIQKKYLDNRPQHSGNMRV